MHDALMRHQSIKSALQIRVTTLRRTLTRVPNNIDQKCSKHAQILSSVHYSRHIDMTVDAVAVALSYSATLSVAVRLFRLL